MSTINTLISALHHLIQPRSLALHLIVQPHSHALHHIILVLGLGDDDLAVDVVVLSVSSWYLPPPALVVLVARPNVCVVQVLAAPSFCSPRRCFP